METVALSSPVGESSGNMKSLFPFASIQAPTPLFPKFFNGFPSPCQPPLSLVKPSPFTRSVSQKSILFAPFAMAATSQRSQTVVPGEVDDSMDFFEALRRHQEAAARLPPINEVRTQLDRSTRGMLSTFSHKHEGYPSGSMVDFACDDDGTPILAISSLAVHTKDLLANPRCSLVVPKDPEDRTDLVITLLGDAILVPENNRQAVRSAYLKKHTDAFWVDFGDFDFVRIEPKVVQYVSGVATALLGSGEFNAEEFKAATVDPISQFSAPVTSHMNRDHAEDTKAIVQHSTSIPVDSAYMVELDSLGFNVKAGYKGKSLKIRVPFPRRAVDRRDVKTLIVEMLQATRISSKDA